MGINKKEAHPDLAEIKERVKQKRHDYIVYDFSRKKNDILKTFFDLSQEFDSLQDLYRICVTVPFEFFDVDSRLYLLNDMRDGLSLVCDSKYGIHEPPLSPPSYVKLTDAAYEDANSYLVPIYSKPLHSVENNEKSDSVGVIGIFEVFPLAKLTKSDKFFFTKYTNRIGYNLRKRLLAQQNITHIKFINNLVSDIEHNVIVPNMYYKHLFKQLRNKIGELSKIVKTIEEYKNSTGSDTDMCHKMIRQITQIEQNLSSSYEEIDKHHGNQSLFLESLFRRDHFQEGRIVLHPQNCRLDKDILHPQLEHYRKRMISRGIYIETPVDLHSEEIELHVDLGLISQVYANLFSNAVKYTETIIDHNNRPRKAIAYGRKIMPDHFAPGHDGIKLNVFSTGPTLNDYDAQSIFIDGFMGNNCYNLNSSGHGLAFVKYVVELHGGQVGYEPTPGGNNFFFVLPLLPK
nr:sensor histidine kinase [Desulfobulbaceae bacterium]